MISLRWLKASWNRFFFRPIPTTALGLFRIGVGALILLDIVMLWPDLNLWFTDSGPLPMSVATRQMYSARLNWTIFLHHFMQDQELAIRLFMGAFAVAAFCLMIGLWTRIASILVFGFMVSLHHRNIYILHSGDTMIRLYTFFLMFAPAGASLSVDRLWRIFTAREEIATSTERAPWAQRMIQFQICVLYLSTGLWKLRGDHWVRGTASYVTLQLDEFKRFWIPEFLRQNLIFSAVGTWFTLIAEFGMALLVWVKELAPYAIFLALLLHLSLDYTMNVPLFQYIMIVGLVLFLKPGTVEKWGAAIRKQMEPNGQKKALVYFDGDCGLCTQIQKVFVQMDWFGTCEWIDFRSAKKSVFKDGFSRERALQEMLVWNRKSWYGGFYAFRKIAHRIPLVWPFLPFLYLPGVSICGQKVYEFVAKNRMGISKFFFEGRVVECPLPGTDR